MGNNAEPLEKKDSRPPFCIILRFCKYLRLWILRSLAI